MEAKNWEKAGKEVESKRKLEAEKKQRLRRSARPKHGWEIRKKRGCDRVGGQERVGGGKKWRG